MKWMLPLLLFASAACSDATTEPEPWEPEELQPTSEDETSDDEKADVYSNDEKEPDETVYAPTCAMEGEQGCDLIGAECCDRPGTTCQEYTVYDWPRCRPPVDDPTEGLSFSVEADTRGGIFACTSPPNSQSSNWWHPIVNVVATDDESEDGFIDLRIEPASLPGVEVHGEEEPPIIENGLASFEKTDGRISAATYYYALEVTAVQGIAGMWTGEVVSHISDDVWEVHCWEPTLTPTARYDSTAARCVDAEGNEASNPTVAATMIRGTRFAECMSLDEVALDEGEYRYQNLSDVTFRGSDLSEASLHFAQIVDADFSGADLSTFEFGYAEVMGQIDAETVAPNGCEPVDGQLDCRR